MAGRGVGGAVSGPPRRPSSVHAEHETAYETDKSHDPSYDPTMALSDDAEHEATHELGMDQSRTMALSGSQPGCNHWLRLCRNQRRSWRFSTDRWAHSLTA